MKERSERYSALKRQRLHAKRRHARSPQAERLVSGVGGEAVSRRSRSPRFMQLVLLRSEWIYSSSFWQTGESVCSGHRCPSGRFLLVGPCQLYGPGCSDGATDSARFGFLRGRDSQHDRVNGRTTYNVFSVRLRVLTLPAWIGWEARRRCRSGVCTDTSTGNESRITTYGFWVKYSSVIRFRTRVYWSSASATTVGRAYTGVSSTTVYI